VTEITINKTLVSFYSSVKELPIDLSKKMNNYLLQETGIGSTIADIDDRMERVMIYLAGDKNKEALEEMKNLRYALFSCINELSYQSMAFGCLVHSINGKEVTDRSTEGLKKMIRELSAKGLSVEHVRGVMEEVKKNLIPKESYISRRSTATT
jgi:hypothetical protein